MWFFKTKDISEVGMLQQEIGNLKKELGREMSLKEYYKSIWESASNDLTYKQDVIDILNRRIDMLKIHFGGQK